jgi:4-hydroxybenzoate polyprenyltransferase
VITTGEMRLPCLYHERMPNKAVALALSTHPGPAVAVTVITVVLGVSVGLEPWRIVLLGLAFAANQASVGLSNDWIDAERDRAVGRLDKPVARGWVDVSRVRTAALVTLALAVTLTIPLGVPATIAHAGFLASAWAYNAGLKSTAASVLPYLLSFGLLPTVVTLALPEPSLAGGWAMGSGALLGVAAHFANVLPDLDDDRVTGVHGLPHRLGLRTTGLATWAALAAASLLAWAGPAGDPTLLQSTGLVLALAIGALGTLLVLRRPPSRLLFRLIIAAALVNVTLLAFARDRLLA